MTKQSSRLRTLVSAFLAVCVASCTGLDPHARVPDEHIVMVNYRGKPVDPTDHPWLGLGHYRQFKNDEFTHQLERVFSHITEYANKFRSPADPAAPSNPASQDEQAMTDVSQSPARQAEVQAKTKDPRAARVTGTKPRPRIVIFIHGGLNTQAGSVARAVKLHKKILADGVYPVFINWQSSLYSSYWDHLFLVRYGEESPKLAWLSAPFLVIGDLLRAIGRAPMTLWNEIDNAFNTASFHSSQDQERGRAIAIAAASKTFKVGGEEINLDVDFPEAVSDSGGGVLTFSRDIVLAIPHMVLGILLDIGGTSSWEIMHRRTTLIMEPERTYRARSVELAQMAAVPRFFKELRQLQRELKPKVDLQIDIICHSMGCIVSNLLLQTARSRDADADALPVFTNIVYMADADSEQKTERAVYSYMLDRRHADTNFYRLSLSDRAEVAETTALYLAPKGSLLVWIDRFFEATPSLPDQRAGKLQNQLFSIHRIPPDLLTRVHLKSFLFRTDEHKKNPTVHGDFSDGKFWRPEYFMPGSKP